MNRILMRMSRNTVLSPHMQCYWRRLPEVQPVDIDSRMRPLEFYKP